MESDTKVLSLSEIVEQQGVSDVHVQLPIHNGHTSITMDKLYGFMRMRGTLIHIPFEGDVLTDILTQKNNRRDFAYTLPSGKRLRIALRYANNQKMVEVFIRVLPKNIPPVFQELRSFLKPVETPSPGLFLVSGPTGSGKSTFLASLSTYYLSAMGTHMVTIEDPIEYLFPATELGYASQREVGIDTPDFATGVKDALREDPDVILIGEIRDPDTAQTALTAAETGHMVLGTIHAGSCCETVERYLALIDNNTYNALRLSNTFKGSLYLTKQKDSIIYESFWNNDAIRTNIREQKTHLLEQNRGVKAREKKEIKLS